MTWGNYRGDRIGLYTVNDTGEHGFVDFDAFEYLVHRTSPQTGDN